MKLNIFQLASKYNFGLEDDSSGVASTEVEYVYYAKLKDPSILEKATHVEAQEQWNFKVAKTDKNAAEGRLRVRKTTIDGKVEYVLTIKTEQKALQATTTQINTNTLSASQNLREVGLEATEDVFEMFKLMADQGMIKTRYNLPVEGTDLVFEVDRFLLPNGEFSEWVKVDLEVKGKLTELPKLPEAFTDVIYNQKDQQTEEEKELVWRLYETVFLTKNTEVSE